MNEERDEFDSIRFTVDGQEYEAVFSFDREAIKDDNISITIVAKKIKKSDSDEESTEEISIPVDLELDFKALEARICHKGEVLKTWSLDDYAVRWQEVEVPDTEPPFSEKEAEMFKEDTFIHEVLDDFSWTQTLLENIDYVPTPGDPLLCLIKAGVGSVAVQFFKCRAKHHKETKKRPGIKEQWEYMYTCLRKALPGIGKKVLLKTSRCIVFG